MANIFPKLATCGDGLCIFSVNVLNEKIYIFLWFWFVFLTTVTGLCLVYRITMILSGQFRYHFLKTRFKFASTIDVHFLYSKFDSGDWFMFCMLIKNIDPSERKTIFSNLATFMRQNDSNSITDPTSNGNSTDTNT